MSSRIESFLSARLFLVPQLVGERIYFYSNLSGHLSLYGMNYGGSVPEPLLPPNIALQNPELIGGFSYHVFPGVDKILVMIDCDGDEVYQPMYIPLEGGFPEPAFDNALANHRVHLVDCDVERNLVYFNAESLESPVQKAFRGDLRANKLEKLAESPYGAFPIHDEDHNQMLFADGYTMGDGILYALENSQRKLVYGKPLEERQPGEVVPLNGIISVEFTASGKGLVLASAVFDDKYSLGYLDLAKSGEIQPVKLEGILHSGVGEMKATMRLKGNRYLVLFNIDGCDWVYEGVFNEEKRVISLRHVLVGDNDLANGVMGPHSFDYDKATDRFILVYSTATSPTQIYTIEGKERDLIVMHTDEKILGIPQEKLAAGEDASFISYDGTRVSARLYLPAASLGFNGQRPLIYYVHGGPQSQERPDFSWFSMPLIQFLTLRGFAVFVPNVRGSTGYGLSYTKQVDKDWGGKDRLDHVHAMTKILPKDKRLDVKRAAVVGRSYGGYMTLTLAGRHPDLWAASCDMFGPYDLLTFSERIPESWKPYFKIALGNPETPGDRAFLAERSPKTYLDNLACPMLVIQGRNDPRVVAKESEELVADLKKKGKQIELLIFENEGHDVLKYENRVTCYNAITDFFAKILKP